MVFFKKSIRTNLLIWLLVPTILLWIGAFWGTYVVSKKLTNAAYDEGLIDTAKIIASRMRISDESIQLDLSAESLSILRQDSMDKVYYQVRGPQGEFLFGDQILPPPILNETQITFRDEVINGSPIRVAVFYLPTPQNSQGVLIQVGETLNARKTVFSKSISRIIPLLTLLLAFAFIITWIAVRQGLAPLEALSKALRERASSDVSSLAYDNEPQEIKPVIMALNDLLSKVAANLKTQERFLQNAAHQLRTPLAGIKMQIDLLLRAASQEDIEKLAPINTSVSRLSRLIKQLLAVTRAQQIDETTEEFSSVDLVSLSSQVIASFVPLALNKSIELSFDHNEKVAFVKGNAHALFDLISNLVENAIIHMNSHGLNSTSVQFGREQVNKVSVEIIHHSFIELTVSDTGPGIPKEERKKIFERFYRGNNTLAPGTGLGLAIVSEVAERHGAKITIEDSEGTLNENELTAVKGTKISVQFKSA